LVLYMAIHGQLEAVLLPVRHSDRCCGGNYHCCYCSCGRSGRSVLLVLLLLSIVQAIVRIRRWRITTKMSSVLLCFIFFIYIQWSVGIQETMVNGFVSHVFCLFSADWIVMVNEIIVSYSHSYTVYYYIDILYTLIHSTLSSKYLYLRFRHFSSDFLYLHSNRGYTRI